MTTRTCIIYIFWRVLYFTGECNNAVSVHPCALPVPPFKALRAAGRVEPMLSQLPTFNHHDADQAQFGNHKRMQQLPRGQVVTLVWLGPAC
eukprot:360065-Chlamydomonas_euryale.AAC.2